MFLLYDVVFIIIAFLYLPRYFFKGKFHRGLWQRIGRIPHGITFRDPIWIHAVSVGEAMTIRNLLLKLKTLFPNRQFVISTVTQTGNQIAVSLAGKDDSVIYLPIDFSCVVKKVIDRINPSLFILTETEFWPNLISYLFKKNIPIVVVNARISERSFRGYRMLKAIISRLLNKITAFCVQTEDDAYRLRVLGVEVEKILVTGNMKFDTAPRLDEQTSFEVARFKRMLALKKGEKLLVAGSTHPGEEEVLLSVYKDLRRIHPEIRLLVAPRHPERAGEVVKIAQRNGFDALGVSQIQKVAGDMSVSETVFVLDTIGKLIFFCGLADIVFVGGSLVKKGGHNIIEPAAFAKPILTGPYTFNFRDIIQIYQQAGALLVVKNRDDLRAKIAVLLNDDVLRNALATKAQELVSMNQGATQRTIDALQEILF